MAKACKWCESTQHTQFYCFRKPRKAIVPISRRRLENPRPRKKNKPINKVGPRARKWNETSKLWKKTNPPDRDGYWYCLVGGSAVTDKRDIPGYRFNLCHNKSRARSPQTAFDLDNLFPGCQKHNKDQGSLSLQEYLETEPDLLCGDF